MRRLALVAVLVVVATPLHADFADVSRALEARLGSDTWIPFFGVARAFIRVTHPDGVHDLQMTVFEGNTALQAAEGERLLTQLAGKGFKPFVRSRSRTEWTSIYARPASPSLMELLVLTNDNSDTVLIRIVADPEMLSRIEHDPHRASTMARK